MSLNMEIVKLSFLLMITFLITTSNLHSQTEQLNKVLRNNFDDTFISLEKGIDKSVFEKVRFENHSNQILKTITFDSTSVVDSVIVTRDTGSELKYRYTYDSHDNISLELREEWDGSQWENSIRITCTYDPNGNMTLYFREEWNGSLWGDGWRETYTYDSIGNMTSYSWGFGRETYTYDSIGNITLELREEWDGSQWVKDYQSTYTYDSIGNMTLYLRENWRSSGWLIFFTYTYTYDSNGNMTSEILESWDYSTWVKRRRHTYTYDSIGNMTLDLSQRWNGIQWENSGRDIYTYDSNGNMTSKLYEDWDTNQWENYFQNTYTYDPNGNRTSCRAEKWDESQWIMWAYSSLDFYDSFGRYYTFYASEIKVYYSTITDVEESEFNVSDYSLSQNYPNPFNPTTKISYSMPNRSYVTFKIFDVLGREITTLVNIEQPSGNYLIEFDASSLTSGIYFYRIQAGQFVESKKMVLLR